MEYLEQIHKQYPEYFNDPTLGFMSCYNIYIVVFRKKTGIRTNENRPNVVNPVYAEFIGDNFIVVNIFCKLDPLKTLNEINISVNNFYEHRLPYKTGDEILVNDFNVNLITTPGIRYFKSVEAAFYHADILTWTKKWIECCGDIPINYSGNWYEYSLNGSKQEEGTYLNGAKHNIWIYYHVNGNIKRIEYYKNGELHGKSTSYYENRITRSEESYKNGKLHGECTFYYTDGKKKVVERFVNGNYNGKSIYYDENENIVGEYDCFNDELIDKILNKKK